MTELVPALEAAGWRFIGRDGQLFVRPPRPRPENVEVMRTELVRRRGELVGYLRAREDANGLATTLGLSYVPVFGGKPEGGKILQFRKRSDDDRAAAAVFDDHGEAEA